MPRMIRATGSGNMPGSPSTIVRITRRASHVVPWPCLTPAMTERRPDAQPMQRSPRIVHVDDVEWQEVRRQQHGPDPGRTASVYERWLDTDGQFLSLYARWDPGMMVQPHGHNSDHVVFVLEGSMTCGDVACRTGTHIALDQGDDFGPFVAGPDGVVLFEVMMGDPRSFPARQDEWHALLAERDVRLLPNPPVVIPGGLEDTRN
jgi:hypothetical protein